MEEKEIQAKTLPDVSKGEQAIVGLILVGSDGHRVNVGLVERNGDLEGQTGNPFSSGIVGYAVQNGSFKFDWNGKEFRVQCNVMLSGSATLERKARAAAIREQKERKALNTQLTTWGFEKPRRERILALVDDGMELQEAIGLAAAEAISGHATGQKTANGEVHA